jgi:hypothetical protein
MISAWPLVELVSQFLDRDEREVVLGDLLESNESSSAALFDVLGLILCRQTALWNDSRPWLASLGIAVPASYLLAYVSTSVSCTYARLFASKVFPDHQAPTGNEGLGLFLCHIFLLLACSWISGYLVGSLSRRTLWVSATFSAATCAFCWAGFCLDFPKATLFVFLVPGTVGAHQGLRRFHISLTVAVLLAITVTILMCAAWTNNALWILNWLLLWPVWLLVATSAATQRPPNLQLSTRPQSS